MKLALEREMDLEFLFYICKNPTYRIITHLSLHKEKTDSTFLVISVALGCSDSNKGDGNVTSPETPVIADYDKLLTYTNVIYDSNGGGMHMETVEVQY